jgi:hypothetical protein
MSGPVGSMLERLIGRLTTAFGEPVCRGDCCWWTLSREGRMPVRLSVFLDSDGSHPRGWLCDLENPATSAFCVDITDEAQIQALLQRVRGMLEEPARAPAAESAPQHPERAQFLGQDRAQPDQSSVRR